MDESYQVVQSYLAQVDAPGNAQAQDAGAQDAQGREGGANQAERPEDVVIDAQAMEGELESAEPMGDAIRIWPGGLPVMPKVRLPRLSDLPTPGGIGLLLFVIGFILFAVTPGKGGLSRLSLVWGSLLGTVTYDANGGQTSGGGSTWSSDESTSSATVIPLTTGGSPV
ncbi:hypothetical protein [Alicyclobacillus kakegawensis]|uniref:hypothetical protein n=1 Tax=Alicyclobacillus kakegawensis TaxID=392012 RepID=UPI000829B6DF|nr:hypothetical protein [Alicyclobacillus kakegawensis]